MTIEIEEFEHLNNSPGFVLAAQGVADLATTGYGPGEASLHWNQKTLVARVDGAVVGVIVWERLEHIRQAWITVGYVNPVYRDRGVYTALYRRLVEVARRESLRSVAGGVAFGNHAMRAVAERQGRAPISITYQELV